MHAQMSGEPGYLIFSGGVDWEGRQGIDQELLLASGGNEVAVLPTAAAYQGPAGMVAAAAKRWAALGAGIREIPVLTRRDAEDENNASLLAQARLIHIGDGSSLHLRSVLQDSKVFAAIVDAWHHGAVVMGEGAGAMVLCDPMIDIRGGALTLGLGVVRGMAVLTGFGRESAEKVHRSIVLAAPMHCVVGVEDTAMLIRQPAGSWRVEGEGHVLVFRHGQQVGMDVLEAIETA
ncbi:MAG: Type 1 glutamine amidotransferase-like domain-containing protein [Actinobacteria bacterium]|nr:Type 1 glutamine amidotransferase-like domain-containing protein [Actinomycetota bacterium]